MEHLSTSKQKYESYLSKIDEKICGYDQLPSCELCIDLSEAAFLANEKLIGYYDVQSDLAICATVLDPRLNISYYELAERTIKENLFQMDSAKNKLLHYYNEMGYTPDEIHNAPLLCVRAFCNATKHNISPSNEKENL